MPIRVLNVPRMDVLPAAFDDVEATIYASTNDLLILLRGEETPYFMEGIETFDVGSPLKADYQDGLSYCFYNSVSVEVREERAQVG